MHPIRRLIQFVMRPFLNVLVRWYKVDDPWAPMSAWVRFDTLAIGSRRPFAWYHQGESKVPVASIGDVCDWLCTCEYVSDRALFQEADFWQHPVTFEQLRRGDCEDHALWAWRKLLELGVDARFVVGSWRHPGHTEWGVHAWVEFDVDGERFHLEPVRNNRAEMTKPIAGVREHYEPHFSVDRSLRPVMHAGMILHYRRIDAARRAARSAPSPSQVGHKT